MRTDQGWIIDTDDIAVGLAGEPTQAWMIREDGTTYTDALPDVTRYITPGVWPRYLCRCEQVRRMIESVDSNYATLRTCSTTGWRRKGSSRTLRSTPSHRGMKRPA
jgi:hypothetical protein